MKTTSTWLRLRPIKFFLAVVMVGCAMFLSGSWSVRAVGLSPAILDLQLHPGDVVQRTVTVVNTEDVSRTFQLTRENFSPSEEPGIPVFDGGAHDDFPSWIGFEPSRLSLPPQSEAPLTVTIAVPMDAPRGDFYGVVFAMPEPAPQASARTALLLFLTVLGEANYDLDLVSFDLDRTVTSSLRNTVTMRAQNAGNVYVKPEGGLTLDPIMGRRIALSANPEGLRLLSGASRTWDVSWARETTGGFLDGLKDEWNAFALGPVTVRVELFSTPDAKESERAQDVFWVFPWRTTLLLLAILLLSLGGLRILRPRI